MFAPKSESNAETPMIYMDEVIPPSSATSMVPSTGIRRGHRDAFPESFSPCMDAIGTTPTKQSSFLRRPANELPAIPPSSPLMERGTMSAGQLFVPGSAIKEQRRINFASSRNEGVFVTPIKKAGLQAADMVTSSPIAPVERKTSIYQQLGWDDDLDDL